jgi:hypothetical protein
MLHYSPRAAQMSGGSESRQGCRRLYSVDRQKSRWLPPSLLTRVLETVAYANSQQALRE